MPYSTATPEQPHQQIFSNYSVLPYKSLTNKLWLKKYLQLNKVAALPYEPVQKRMKDSFVTETLPFSDWNVREEYVNIKGKCRLGML